MVSTLGSWKRKGIGVVVGTVAAWAVQPSGYEIVRPWMSEVNVWLSSGGTYAPLAGEGGDEAAGDRLGLGGAPSWDDPPGRRSASPIGTTTTGSTAATAHMAQAVVQGGPRRTEP